MEMTDHQLIASLKRVQENIQTTMAELASLKEEMLVQKEKEERSKIFMFIENSKRAGFTTDLSTMAEFIEKKFSLEKGRATAYLIDYIESSASNLSQISPPVAPPVAPPVPPLVAPPVKRKGPKPYSEMTPEELAIAKAAKAAKLQHSETSAEVNNLTEVSNPESTAAPVKEKRVLGIKKITDASKIWYSFLKKVQTEMEATGEKPKYEDILKRAKELKGSDKEAYQLFSSKWISDNHVASN